MTAAQLSCTDEVVTKRFERAASAMQGMHMEASAVQLNSVFLSAVNSDSESLLGVLTWQIDM